MTHDLTWITEEDFDKAVTDFVAGTGRAIKEVKEKMIGNVIDPFSSLSLASAFGTTSSRELNQFQTTIAATRGMDNPLGDFHHDVLSCVAGWEKNPGYDLKSNENKMIAEIKNKHNTLNSKAFDKTISVLKEGIRSEGSGWKAFLVTIIPKKPERFSKEAPGYKNVFIIDGASFYTLVTGQQDALEDMFYALMEKLQEKRGQISKDIQEYCAERFNLAFGK